GPGGHPRAFGGLPRVLVGDRDEALPGLAQKFRGRAVDTGDGRVAGGAVIALIPEGLEAAPIGLAHILVGSDELADQLRSLWIGHAGLHPFAGAAHVAFALLERVPVLVERFGLLAAKQRVLPLLN